jgi:hypothetical protein
VGWCGKNITCQKILLSHDPEKYFTGRRRLKGGFGWTPPPRLQTPLAFFYFLLSLGGFGGPPPKINILLFKLSPLLKECLLLRSFVTERGDL